MTDINKLLDVMAALRDPQTGCPWDLEQDYRSIAPYTIEEAYEVADVIERDALDELPDELGDLLFQIAFYAQLASEENRFSFQDIVDAICKKMIRRHPHVFEAAPRGDADLQIERWEQIKQQERAAKKARESALDDVPAGMAALTRSAKLGARASRAGFDWACAEDVLPKIDEERQELAEAMQTGQADLMEEELGDLLFSVVQLARSLEIDPEQSLRRANRKFEKRFRSVEADYPAGMHGVSTADLEAAWQQAKKKNRSTD